MYVNIAEFETLGVSEISVLQCNLKKMEIWLLSADQHELFAKRFVLANLESCVQKAFRRF